MTDGSAPSPTHAPDPSGRPASDLLPLVYDELHRLAAAYLRSERQDHTLQPTALVHEAYLKLADQSKVAWNDSTHFKAVAATAMRQVLVDHARRRATDKRGGDWLRVTLDHAAASPVPDIDLLALDEAMSQLARYDSRKARVVELRFFGGLTCDEAAKALGISPKTAEADWYMARAWLKRRLAGANT